MSYILDELKKSEQDRGNGSIPSVQTIHSSSLNYHQEKRPIWPWLLIVALIINVAILVYFFKPESKIENIASRNDIPAKHLTAVVQQDNSTTNSHTAPAITAEPIAPTTNTEITETNAIARPKVSAPVVDIDELPTNIRQQIPGMVFSAHVYSSDPMQRSLVINNRFMEEGHAINSDLTLIEITPNGAIFDFGGYRFSTGILSGWSTH